MTNYDDRLQNNLLALGSFKNARDVKFYLFRKIHVITLFIYIILLDNILNLEKLKKLDK